MCNENKYKKAEFLICWGKWLYFWTASQEYFLKNRSQLIKWLQLTCRTF